MRYKYLLYIFSFSFLVLTVSFYRAKKRKKGREKRKKEKGRGRERRKKRTRCMNFAIRFYPAAFLSIDVGFVGFGLFLSLFNLYLIFCSCCFQYIVNKALRIEKK